MASPPATALCTARPSFRFRPRTALLLLVAVLAAPRPTRSSSSPNAAVVTSCSGGHGQSAAAVTGGELVSFLAALCLGAAHGVADAHMSHTMSLHVAEKNRTVYGVAQCRPDVPAPDCAACLAAASSRLIAAGSAAACAAASAAVWHDDGACFLRYSSDRDRGVFREDEFTATVFNASRALSSPPPPHEVVVGRAAVTRLLAAVGNRTVRSRMCRGVGSGRTRTTAAGAGGVTVYGLTRCAAGTSCDGCRRCLRGALAVVEREYNGSAGMQVLRLSCMVRYESYPFYNATSLRLRRLADRRDLADAAFGSVPAGSRADGPPTPTPTPTASGGSRICSSINIVRDSIVCTGVGAPPPTLDPSVPTAQTPTPAPPGGGGRTPPPPVAAPPPPFTSSIGVPATVGGRGLTPAQPTPAPSGSDGGGHTVHAPQPPPAAAAPSPDERVVITQHRQTKTHKMAPIIILSIPTATGIVVIAVIVGFMLHRRRKQTVQLGYVVDGMRRENMHDQGKEQQSDTEVEDDDADTMSCQLYSYHVLEAATCHFSSSNKLGSGGFGTVFKGTLESGKEVAVKRLRDSKRNIQELEGEISIVADLRHKNLVRYLGYCFQEEGKFLVYEYVPNNSLANFWYRAPFQYQKLDWATWFNIILGVARGLRFLHEKGIIHRDLKPHNVLLDENFNPKIADFDLMRVYDKQKTHESTEKVAGTFGYMAPECTSGRKFLLSIKSDVYSYGVLVLEIITGHKIYTFEGQNSEGLVEFVWQHWTEKTAGDVADGDLLGLGGQEHALRQAMRCVHVALLCVQADRSKRPDMGQVIAMLRSDGGAELPEPSLPGYVVRSTTASGVRLRCMGYR